MDSKEIFYCNFVLENGDRCDKNYFTDRPENLSRHISGYHLGEKEKCECGKQMTKSSLIRHKKQSCSLRKNVRRKPNNKNVHRKPDNEKFDCNNGLSASIDPSVPNITGD